MVTEVKVIDPSGFILKTQYNTDKSGLEKKIQDADKKISDTSWPIKKTVYKGRILKIEAEILLLL